MITTKVLEHTPVLTANKEHKNFTDTGKIIKKGTSVSGEFKTINGLKRGKPFSYKVFITEDDEIIYSKYVKPMETREITLGADAAVTPTKVDFIPNEDKKHTELIIGAAAGIAGYLISRKMKYSRNKTLAITLIAAAAGYIVTKQVQKRKGILVQKSK